LVFPAESDGARGVVRACLSVLIRMPSSPLQHVASGPGNGSDCRFLIFATRSRWETSSRRPAGSVLPH